MAESAGVQAVSPCGFGGGAAPSGSGGEAGAAAGAEGAGAGGFLASPFLPLIAIFLIFYFMIIRPQRKRQKEHDKMLSGINRGDQIVTIGGFLGTVRDVREDTFQIELAENVRVRILKSAVQSKRQVNNAPAANIAAKEQDKKEAE
ncbi:MAG: preprotein translocase subunit YajC [Synergistaceae bacterium]|nr:preprotein translocase subunit YajC [Synergistaceae bacterium]MBQ3625287.1 preprotein translocase subunit YajC [Synergistaceae bacterium]MBQ4418317.1 preprotein translocase subunit YajC [Synergistaceae bacterium]MBQ6910013.1 preprotein translocase subunit YajC [Synergistaceae bacterium]MBQ9580855.1 preprotein translocase subunit YajC [Synergistaceae bacterium]